MPKEDERDPTVSETSSATERSLLLPRATSALPFRTPSQQKRQEAWDYLSYYLPILRWLPEYNPRLFLGDLCAGVTLACLLVPQSMSYAQNLARVDPVHGLFAASIPSFIYAVLGTCAQLSVGPEAALSLLVGQTVSHYTSKLPQDASPEEINTLSIAVVTILTALIGLVTFLLGIFRLGFLDAVLSRPLLRGFITAVGVIIFIQQMVPLLGLQALEKAQGIAHSPMVHKIAFLARNFKNAHRLTLIVSVFSAGSLIAFRIVKPKLVAKFKALQFFPEILLVVIVTTALAQVFRWDLQGLVILGAVSAKHVKPVLPLKHWRFAGENMGTASIIAVMGYVDSIIAAKQNASRFNYPMSPNRELVALGAANIASSCIAGTLPGFGSMTRSRLNANAGARTPMASLITATAVILTTYYLLPYLYFLPAAVLSSIILLVVYSLLIETPHDVAFFWRLHAWSDLLLMLVTFTLTLFWSVVAGITISIGLSLVLVVQKSSSMSIKVMGKSRTTSEWTTLDATSEEEEEIPGVLIARIRESMTFANTGVLKEQLRRLERYGKFPMHPSKAPVKDEAKQLVLHMGDVDAIDPSAAQVLYEVIETYIQRGTLVNIVQPRDTCLEVLLKAGIIDLISEENVYATVPQALSCPDHQSV